MHAGARALGVTLAAVATWAGTAALVNSPLLVPPPRLVFESFLALAQSGELAHHLGASLSRLAVGLLVGVPLGAILGCAMGRWSTADALLNPFVGMFNAIPALALVPFSLLWFGVTEFSRYMLLIYTVSLTVLLAARQGVRSIPSLRGKVASNLGLGPVASFFHVTLPSCFPSILAGVRTAIGLGVMVIVAAEMLGAESGLGYLIMQARAQFNMGNMLVGVLGLGALSLLLDRTFSWVTEVALPRWSAERRVR
jgi:ABC-type nitrate/sulfonate/bicarbonate transport system permease component